MSEIRVANLAEPTQEEIKNAVRKRAEEVLNIVRCKDCKKWDKNQKFCTRYRWVMDEDMVADDFCSRGERKDECNR